MDYRTLFLTFLASLSVYAACACLLALRNRRVAGLSWIAAGLVALLVAVILQGFEGRVPTFLSSFVSSELYFPSFVMQMFGLRWFVDRTRLTLSWLLRTGGLLAALYAILYFFHIGYVPNVIDIPSILILAATAWILLRHGRGTFRQASRLASVFLFGEAAVYGYRTAMTNVIYADPWLVSGNHQDPRWLYSVMALMFFSTCLVMCEFWFFVLELQRELKEQARTDALTGALNRRALYEEAEREVSRNLRTGNSLCLLLLDVDDFKALNDNFGHAAGDYVLCRLVDQVKAILRTQDILARTGGEEFAVLLPETTRGHATQVAERIRISLATMKLTFGSVQMELSVSIGVAEMIPPFSAFETALQHADTAMYTAKRNGKNSIVFFDAPIAL